MPPILFIVVLASIQLLLQAVALILLSRTLPTTNIRGIPRNIWIPIIILFGPLGASAFLWARTQSQHPDALENNPHEIPEERNSTPHHPTSMESSIHPDGLIQNSDLSAPTQQYTGESAQIFPPRNLSPYHLEISSCANSSHNPKSRTEETLASLYEETKEK